MMIKSRAHYGMPQTSPPYLGWMVAGSSIIAAALMVVNFLL